MKKLVALSCLLLLIQPIEVVGKDVKGNQTIESFNKAKKLLENKVIFDQRLTIYCQAPFDDKKMINLPKDFQAPNHQSRSSRVEWEHIVPAENFGRFFSEWREGAQDCVDNRGRAFKGRKCVEKVNVNFRLMQSDMYNLYPSIGSVNAVRGNKNFTKLPESAPNSFGSCAMKLEGNKVEPPTASRGAIARAYKYMASAYPKFFRLSSQQEKLMNVWDRAYPPEKWECLRSKRIEGIQGNENPYIKIPCQSKGLW